MAKLMEIAKLSELKPGSGETVDVENASIALFNVNGMVHAIDNTCRHRGGPLGEGQLDGQVVTCPWHGWQFDVTNGNCLTKPEACLTRYPVKIEGDKILVEL